MKRFSRYAYYGPAWGTVHHREVQSASKVVEQVPILVRLGLCFVYLQAGRILGRYDSPKKLRPFGRMPLSGAIAHRLLASCFHLEDDHLRNKIAGADGRCLSEEVAFSLSHVSDFAASNDDVFTPSQFVSLTGLGSSTHISGSKILEDMRDEVFCKKLS